ncbi:MAG TPA: PAS domain S-box protein, partial [Candidatus Binatia bacterium]
MADQDRPNAIARARPRRASLRSHLILLVVVTVVPLLIFSGIVFFLFARDERRAMEGGLRETARALRQVVDGRASDVTTTLQALATSEVFDGGNPNDFYRVAARVLPTQEGWKTILLHDASGKPLFNLLRPPGVGPRPMIDRKSFDEALRTKRPVFVGYLTAPNAGPVVGFRVPIVRGGEVRYVITAGIDPKLFADLLLKQKLPPGWVAVVFDRNHRVIARVPEPEKYVGQPVGALFGRLDPSAAEGWLGGLNREGVRSYAAFSRSEADGYTVALMVPAAAIDAPLWRSLWAVAAAGLVFLALGVSLATVVGRRIAEPIKSLASSAQALGRGEAPLPRPASTVQELEALGKSIEESGRLLEDRRLIEQARWESEQRLGAIFSQLTVGIAECDLEGRFLLVNHRYSEIVGRSPEDLLAMRLQDIVHPEDLARHLDQYRRVIAGEAIALIEKRYVCPNGDTVWVSGGMSVVSDVSGSPQYVVSVSQDVSDRKRAEEELYRLKDELEHRVVQRTEELTRTNVELFRTLDQREKLEAQLRQAHKMEAIGALAGGIAHDFNNLLGIIAVHASALAEESAAPLEAAEQARAILDASQRGAALVQQLLT